MICVSVGDRDDLRAINSSRADMVEIRADLCALSVEELKMTLSELEKPCIVTYRSKDYLSSDVEEVVGAAIDCGVEYVDLGTDMPASIFDRLYERAREKGVKVIVSFHNFEGTNSIEELKELFGWMQDDEASVVKLVCMAHNTEQAVRVMQLYKEARYGDLVVFAMGEAGKFTRPLSLDMGAPFVYASMSADCVTAPGQMTVEDMLKVRGVEAYPYCFREESLKVFGSVQLPCSKSVAQRMILAAALACGVSVLRGFIHSGDSDAALAVARSLGASVEVRGEDIEIEGVGGCEGKLKGVEAVSVGESGLLARMMLPLALYINGESEKGQLFIEGAGTLRGRDMRAAVEAVESVGVKCSSDSGRVPFEVNGSFSGGRVEISGESSSQIVTGFLMALPLLEGDSTLVIHSAQSVPYIYLTLDVLSKFGIGIAEPKFSDGDMIFEIRGGQSYRAAEVEIEKDWSAAVPFVVMGAMDFQRGGELTIMGLSEQSFQADKSVMELVTLAGGSAVMADGGVLTVRGGLEDMKPFSFDATHCPDIIPAAVLLALCLEGRSEIKGTDRLLEKESNRAQMLFSEFSVLGGEIEIKDNSIIIEGRGELVGGRVSSGGDHRMAMVLAMASRVCSEPLWLDDIECVKKSFPNFFEALGYKNSGI
ncbi:MAG: type I 3-dehydroquinate dehydratase [Rikenellaceae bacterium]